MLNPCSHATAEALSNGQPFVTCIHATFSILTYNFEAVTELAQLHRRLHDTSDFRHFPHESARNFCLESSAWYHVESPCSIVQKIRARLRRYPCLPALEIRGILRKNVIRVKYCKFIEQRGTSSLSLTGTQQRCKVTIKYLNQLGTLRYLANIWY